MHIDLCAILNHVRNPNKERDHERLVRATGTAAMVQEERMGCLSYVVRRDELNFQGGVTDEAVSVARENGI